MLILGHVELIFIFFVNHEEWMATEDDSGGERITTSIAGESSA